MKKFIFFVCACAALYWDFKWCVYATNMPDGWLRLLEFIVSCLMLFVLTGILIGSILSIDPDPNDEESRYY